MVEVLLQCEVFVYLPVQWMGSNIGIREHLSNFVIREKTISFVTADTSMTERILCQIKRPFGIMSTRHSDNQQMGAFVFCIEYIGIHNEAGAHFVSVMSIMESDHRVW